MGAGDQEKDPVLEDKIAQNRRVLVDYPGFLTPEDRRVSDESLRRLVTRMAADFLQQMASLDVFLVRRNEVDLRSALGVAGQHAEMVIDKVQSVPYAFSPFYQVDWLPTDTCYRIVNDDLRIIDVVTEAMGFLEPTLGGDSDFAGIVRRAGQLLDQVDERLETRVTTIMEFQG